MGEMPVETFIEGAVGVIELARPEKFNCLSRRCFELIGAALSRFESDSRIHSLLIRAQGLNFCTGADLDQVNDFEGDGGAASDNARLGHAVLRQLELSRLPIVAAVQGLCLAGGLELMLACDVVFASASARLGDQHARYGLIPGWGGTQRLPRLVGLRRSLDLFFSARWIPAETAEKWGLVNQVVADETLHAAAMEYCRQLSRRNPQGLALMKRLARAGLDAPLDDGLAAELREIPGLVSSAGVREGLSAFTERREPHFP